MTIEQLYRIYLKHPVISTDTRNIQPGSIFFALRGDRFNANTFAAEAIRSGAAYVVIDEKEFKAGEKFLLVNNVLEALQGLAKYHRSQLEIPFIGITGSNGKTTTKELAAAVLSRKFRTVATQGNLNNHIGVPLTLLGIRPDTELAIIEMGANHQGEIASLCDIAQPTHGLVTNVGKAHLEGFGGFEGIKKGKGELYSYLSATGGTAFINGRNNHLLEMMTRAGLEQAVHYNGIDAAVTGSLISSDPFLKLGWTTGQGENFIQSNLAGSYNLDNILAAVCLGCYFGLTPAEITIAIESYIPANNRSQIVETGNNRLICDYYNANPASMLVALDNLKSLEAGHKAMILGDMFELGDESDEEHRLILEKALGIEAGRRIFAGEAFYAFEGQYPGAEFYRTTEEALEALKAHPVRNTTLLLKGSRGMKLEGLIGEL